MTRELRLGPVRAGAGQAQKTIPKPDTHKAWGTLSASDRALGFWQGMSKNPPHYVKIPQNIRKTQQLDGVTLLPRKSKAHLCDIENTRNGFSGYFGCPKNTEPSTGSGICSSGDTENITQGSLDEMRKWVSCYSLL